MDYEIYSEWQNQEGVCVFTCKAVKDSRILGKVTLDVGIEDIQDMRQYIPDEAKKTLEEAAFSTLRSMVELRYNSQ